MDNLARLSIRICLDIIPNKLDGKTVIYCFAHNNINLKLIADAIKDKSIIYQTYILNNKKYMSGVSQGVEVENFYKSNNINVKLIEYNEDWINTKIESNCVIDWAHKNEVKNIIICAPVFHIVRAFMTIVSSIIEKNININIYALPAMVNNWNNETISHQGLNKTSFNNFIQIELDRIIKYTEKGDIKEPEEIWKYILNR